jgi:hypothetical protein
MAFIARFFLDHLSRKQWVSNAQSTPVSRNFGRIFLCNAKHNMALL